MIGRRQSIDYKNRIRPLIDRLTRTNPADGFSAVVAKRVTATLINSLDAIAKYMADHNPHEYAARNANLLQELGRTKTGQFILKKARQMRRFFIWDDETILQIVLIILESYGFRLNKQEVDWVNRNMQLFHRYIYS